MGPEVPGCFRPAMLHSAAPGMSLPDRISALNEGQTGTVPRHADLEPDTLTGLSVLINLHTIDFKDIVDKEEVKPGHLAKTPGEQVMFLVFRNPDSVVLVDQGASGCRFTGGDPDFCNLFPVLHRVVDKVPEHFFDDRICVYLQVLRFVRDPVDPARPVLRMVSRRLPRRCQRGGCWPISWYSLVYRICCWITLRISSSRMRNSSAVWSVICSLLELDISLQSGILL